MHMKKKLLALLCVLTCIFGLTACGTVALSEKEQTVIAYAEQYADMLVQYADYYTVDAFDGFNKEEVALAMGSQLGFECELGAFEGFVTTYNQMKSDMGEVVAVLDPTSEIVGKEVIVTYPVKGSKCDGEMVFKFSNDIFTRFHEGDCQAQTTFAMKMSQAGSNMGKAGLNTLLGMGTVFIMLIVISFIISAFKLLQRKPKEAPKAAAPVATPAPEVVEEELVDDTELVAVIMAAIKAYEGNGSTDGFVVRSIKKANRRM